MSFSFRGHFLVCSNTKSHETHRIDPCMPNSKRNAPTNVLPSRHNTPSMCDWSWSDSITGNLQRSGKPGERIDSSHTNSRKRAHTRLDLTQYIGERIQTTSTLSLRSNKITQQQQAPLRPRSRRLIRLNPCLGRPLTPSLHRRP